MNTDQIDKATTISGPTHATLRAAYNKSISEMARDDAALHSDLTNSRWESLSWGRAGQVEEHRASTPKSTGEVKPDRANNQSRNMTQIAAETKIG